MERTLRTGGTTRTGGYPMGQVQEDNALTPQLEQNPLVLRCWHKNYEIPICDEYKDFPLIKIDPSRTRTSDLVRASVKELILRRPAFGKYVVLRTLEQAKKVNGITTIVEDHEGNIVVFCVYNFTSDLNPDLADLLPVGTVFLLKEPYINKSKEGDCFLRCDCPSDMTVVYPGHRLFKLTEGITWKHIVNPIDDLLTFPNIPTTAREWTDRGDFLFKSEKVQQAIRCYYQATLRDPEDMDSEEECPEVEVTLKLAEAFYTKGFFEKALDLAYGVLAYHPLYQEANFLAGRSCYKLRKYDLAVEYFKHCGSSSEEVLEELKKAEDRVAEKNGKYEMLIHLMNRDSRKLIDCADYTGPIVRCKLGANNRGIITNDEVDPGTLLLVSKSYAFSWKTSLSPVTGKFHRTENSHLVAQLAQLILKNPATFSWQIQSMNNSIDFQPAEEDLQSVYCDPDTKQEPIVDIGGLKSIVDEYGFCDIGENEDYKIGGLLQEGNGVLPMAAYFNHSCMPNAVAHAFSDVLFVRATQHISENEEVYLPYISWEAPYEKRKEFCESYKFNCYCHLCSLDAAPPIEVRVKREALIAKYIALRKDICQENSENFAILIKRARKLILEFCSALTFEYSPHIRDALISLPTVLLCRAFALENENGVSTHSKKLGKYVQHLKLRMFDPEVMMRYLVGDLKFSNCVSGNAVLDDTLIESIVGIIKIYSQQNGEVVNLRNWIQILCAMEKMYSGNDFEAIKYKFNGLERILSLHEAAESEEN